MIITAGKNVRNDATNKMAFRLRYQEKNEEKSVKKKKSSEVRIFKQI